MSFNLLLISIFLPIVFGAVIFWGNFEQKMREIVCMCVCIGTSAVVLFCIFSGKGEPITLFHLTANIPIAFKLDGIGRIFALLLAVLWPIASLWSFEYMYHEGRPNTFFGYYTATYGITLGIALSANLITMYLFYELLTLITIPLIMHSRNEFSKPAGIKYIAYSIAGATAAFVGIMIFYSLSGEIAYTEGGIAMRVLMAGEVNPLYYLSFLLMFFGFGVKAAVFPLYEWLPSVGVAPTPVTALLHAVAVVKSGCFAIIRITYYAFGVYLLRGTWVQAVVLVFVSFTIAFGSIWANRETHFKRRLAMSTVSNLSYILLGAMTMTATGLLGACMHMLYHGIMKITLFFTAGTCHVQAHADYVTDLKGFGKKMPITFGAYTIASLALVGVPPLCGFFSKYILGVAAVQEAGFNWFAYLGVAALLISAVYTAFYLLSVVVNAYFPGKDFDYESISEVKDPSWKMLVPFCILSVLCIAAGVCHRPIMYFVAICLGGLF